MFFLNFSGPEFFALLSALSAVVSALYLLDRARGRRVVSTLQFWVVAGATEQQQPRRRLREPWSLVLQLASLALLLLAIAGLEWGDHDGHGRNHIVLIDTSSWAAARAAEAPNETVLAREKRAVLRYIGALPAGDRVMLVAASGLAEPVTPFTSDRAELRSALAQLQAGYSALDAEAVLSFTSQAGNSSDGSQPEVVYTGPQLVDRTSTSVVVPNRILPIPADREDCGI